MWNRPNENKVEEKKRGGQGNVHFKGIVAGLIVTVLGAAVAWWLFSGADARQDAESKKRGLIKEVKPSISTNKVAKTPKRKFPGAPEGWDKPYHPKAYWPDGTLKKHSKYVFVKTNAVNKASLSIEAQTFTLISDRDIANILTMEPGEPIVGGLPEFDQSFVKRFIDSLNHPIEDAEDDTPEQRELRQAVRDARKDLKARFDAGEDIAKIMTDSYKENQELCLYKEELEREVDRIYKEKKADFSDKDVEDLIGAANKMLDERGIPPLKATEIFKRKMMMKAKLKARKEGKLQNEGN